MKIKIFPKTAIVLLSISLIPLIAVSLISYIIAKRTITKQTLNQLESVAGIQKNRIESGINRQKERLDLVRSRVPMLVALELFFKTGEKSQQDIAVSALAGAKSAIKDFRDISILDRDGKVAASTNALLHGRDLSKEEYFIRGINDYSLDIFSFDDKGEIVNYLSCPVTYQGRLIGAAVIESSFEPIFSLTRDYTGLGETGESTLAMRDKNGDALFIVPLRFDKKAALKKTVLQHDTKMPMVQALLKNERTFEDAFDYRSEHVLAATRYIKDTDWGLVVKIDRDEAFRPLYQLRNIFIVVLFITVFLIIAVAFLIGRLFVKPIIALTNVAKEISGGDLSQRVEITSADEVGDLQQYFNKMTEDLIAERLTLEQKVKERTSELEAANKALEKSNKELEYFASVASHDLQEPLVKIAGFAGLLAKKYKERLDEKANEYIQYITGGAERMRLLINDLLAYSRVTTRGKEFEAIDCNSVLEHVLRDMEIKINESNAVIDTGGLPVVMADELQLGQVFQNLIGNAIKFRGDEPPKIRVSAEKNGNEWVFSVKDNGIGIEHEYLDRIFLMFERLHTKHEYPGTGIGLAICKKIIERHGGNIWVESEHGKGSVFYFTIPERRR